MRILPLLLLPLCALAAEKTEVYSYLYSGKTVSVRVGETGGMKVNDICLNDRAKCTALKILRGPSKLKQLKGTKQGNFAGGYCELLGGTQLFAHKGEEPNEQFCVFPDLTLIDAKALYRRHQGAQR